MSFLFMLTVKSSDSTERFSWMWRAFPPSPPRLIQHERGSYTGGSEKGREIPE